MPALRSSRPSPRRARRRRPHLAVSRCSSRFGLPAIPVEVTSHSPVRELQLDGAAQTGISLPRFDAERLLGMVEAEPDAIGQDPGDSHYVLSPDVVEDASGSSYDLPVNDPAGPTARIAQSTAAISAASVRSGRLPASIDLLDPWYDRVITSWGRMYLFAGLGLGGFSLFVFSILILGTILAGSPLAASTSLLIVGLFVSAALFFLCTAATTLNFVLLELARESRRLRFLEERGSALEGK